MTRWNRGDVFLICLVICFSASVTLLFYYFDQSAFLRGETSRGQVFGRDFAVFWTASRLALTGLVSDIFDTALFQRALGQYFGDNLAFNPFPYPPHAILLILPLGLLSYYWSFLIWVLIQLFLYLMIAAAGGPLRQRVSILLMAPTTLLTINFGQNGLLTAALFLGGMMLLERRPVLAGVCFALLTFKPQLGLLIPVALLAGRYWSAFLAAAVGTVILMAWSLWFGGTQTWYGYMSVGLPDQRAFMEQGTGMFMYMIPSVFMAIRLMDLGIAAGYAAQGLFALCAVAGVAWAFRTDADRALKTAALISGTFLVSPYIFNYDMPLLSVVVLCLAERGLGVGFHFGERLILIAAWILPLAVMGFNVAGWPIGPVVLGMLFASVLYRVYRSTAFARSDRGIGS